MIAYKYVDSVNGKLVSDFDNNFVYPVSGYAEARPESSSSGIYCFTSIEEADKAGVKDSLVLIEVEGKEEDIVFKNDWKVIFRRVLVKGIIRTPDMKKLHFGMYDLKSKESGKV